MELGGIPLVAHSILTAKLVSRISDIFVSTDSEEIEEVARRYGAKTITRPKELSGDQAPEWLAWRHAVEHVEQNIGSFDLFLSLPATSPLRSAEDVENCLNAIDSDTDAVITVTPASRSPYFNMVTRTNAGTSKLMMDAGTISRRQDAPAAFDITTVAYALRPQFILENKSLFSGNVKSVIVPKNRAVDIDDAIDFELAQVLYGRKSNES